MNSKKLRRSPNIEDRRDDEPIDLSVWPRKELYLPNVFEQGAGTMVALNADTDFARPGGGKLSEDAGAADLDRVTPSGGAVNPEAFAKPQGFISKVDNTFHDVWGTGGVTAAPEDTGTRVLDPNSFASTWLKAAPPEPVKENTETATSAINAATGGAIEGLPIIGPPLKAGTEKLSAKIRSLMYGTPYDEELKAVQSYNKQSAEAHPVVNTTGQVAGAVAPMLVGAGLAPRAFGAAGSLLERAGFGAGSNALINSADSAVRGGNADDIAHSGGVGAAIGAAAPVVGRGLGIAGNKVFGSTDKAVNALAAKAEAMGIPIRFPQTSDSPFIAKLSQMAGKLPGSGMDTLHGEQQTAFNRAIAKTFGEDADRITPDVMASAKKRLGNEFDTVAKNSTIKFDQPLGQDLHSILHEAGTTLTDSEANILHKQVGNILDKVTGSGEIEGKTYQALTRKGTPLDRAMNSSDPNVKHYAGRIKEALDDALERHAPADQVEKLKTARGQYKAMKTIEDLSEKSPTGDISPALLMNPVRQSYGNMAYGGGGQLADLARIGQRFMRQPPDSGTPLGTAALNLLLGAGGAGVAGYSSGYDPISMLKGAALLPATALTARGATTLLNRPQAVNALLQRAAPAAVPAYNQLSQQQ